MKILIIKLRNIGDVLLISPLFYNLKKYYGDSCILDVLVNAGTEKILQTQYLNQIHTLKRNPNKLQRIYDELALLKAIKKEKYDMVIGLTSGERSAFLAFWSGAKIRVGFPPNSFWSKNLYTHKLTQKYQHNLEDNLEALRILNIPILSKKVLAPMPQKTTNLNNLPPHFIHLHLFSRWFFKCLDDSFCAKIIDAITQTYHIPCVLTAAKDSRESKKLQNILKLCHSKPLYFDGTLTLPEVSLLNSKALAFVGVDTAIMHLSAANNIPTFAFFGPSGVASWGPWDNDLDSSTYNKQNGIQQMGKHFVYQEDFDCIPCGRAGCNDTKISDCLLSRLNQQKALSYLLDFLNNIIRHH